MLEIRENVIMTAKGQLHGRGFAAGPHIEQSILSEHGAFLVFSHLFFLWYAMQFYNRTCSHDSCMDCASSFGVFHVLTCDCRVM